MSFTCPSCGHDAFDPYKQCICGYNADESTIHSLKETGKGASERMSNKKAAHHKVESQTETCIKEIDSWSFTYSQTDNCMYLSTPALKSFRLKITLNDLEELLEYMYQKNGAEKTTRKLHLSLDELPDLIHIVDRLIAEKRSKVKLNYSENELKGILGLINAKLKL